MAINQQINAKGQTLTLKNGKIRVWKIEDKSWRTSGVRKDNQGLGEPGRPGTLINHEH